MKTAISAPKIRHKFRMRHMLKILGLPRSGFCGDIVRFDMEW